MMLPAFPISRLPNPISRFPDIQSPQHDIPISRLPNLISRYPDLQTPQPDIPISRCWTFSSLRAGLPWLLGFRPTSELSPDDWVFSTPPLHSSTATELSSVRLWQDQRKHNGIGVWADGTDCDRPNLSDVQQRKQHGFTWDPTFQNREVASTDY